MGSDDDKHTPLCSVSGRHRWDVFFDTEWPQHRKEHAEVMRKINEMHSGILAIRQDTRHLPVLDTISGTLREMKDSLIDVVSGKNIVDVDTVKDMLKAQQQAYSATIATICKIFGTIIIILVGLKLLVPTWFGG